jgi:hypothetical protein
MFIAIILILFAAAMFLILHDDHDDSYTRSEKKSGKNLPQQSYQKNAGKRPAGFMDPRTVVPQEKQFHPKRAVDVEPKKVSLAYLDRIQYDQSLPELTMSSFIAGLQTYCTEKDLGGLVGLVITRPEASALEVHDDKGRLMGYLPMKDRANFLAFNPTGVECPFAGHVDISITGKYYADIRIVLPSSRDFVVDSLRSFLG